MGVDDAKRRRLFLQIGQHAYQNDVLDDIGKAAGVKGVSVIHGRGWPIRADVMSSTRLLRVMAGLVPPRERSGGLWPKTRRSPLSGNFGADGSQGDPAIQVPCRRQEGRG